MSFLCFGATIVLALRYLVAVPLQTISVDVVAASKYIAECCEDILQTSLLLRLLHDDLAISTSVTTL